MDGERNNRALARQRVCAAAALAIGGGLVSAPAHSADDHADFGGVGVRFGTAGFALDYTYGINRYVDVRGGYHFGSYDREQEEDGIAYQGELEISAFTAMADIKPFGGGFRLSLGAFSSPPELALKANGRDDYELGDATYRGDLVLNGDLDLGSLTPYFGLGWGGTANATGFGASFDIGVMFAKSPDVSLAVNGRACDASPGTGNPDCDPSGAEGFDVNGDSPQVQAFQANVDREARNLEDETEDFNMWPVIMLGLHYRF